MRSRRTITLTIASLMTLSAAFPVAAWAGPLLSGYGGPGQGSQAIIGGGLVNGGGGPATAKHVAKNGSAPKRLAVQGGSAAAGGAGSLSVAARHVSEGSGAF